jgi:zinc transport system permease protein
MQQAEPGSDLDFDGLLENGAAGRAGTVPGPTAESAPATATTVQQAAPASLHDFVGAWDLYADPVMAGVVAGVALGVVGIFVVLRRAVFITAAVGQSAALGVAVAFFMQIHWSIEVPPLASGLAFALLATALLGIRVDKLRLPRESVLGFLYIAASAVALLVGDRISQEAHDISSILFGTAVLVRPEDAIALTAVSVVVLAAIALTYRGLVYAGFDPEGARVQGLPVRFLEVSLWVLVALEVSVATRALGALPVFAFAVLPAMTLLTLVERLRWAVLGAAVLGACSGGLGYLLAYLLELPVGASQAALATLFFAVSLLFTRLFQRLRASGT